MVVRRGVIHWAPKTMADTAMQKLMNIIIIIYSHYVSPLCLHVLLLSQLYIR